MSLLTGDGHIGTGDDNGVEVAVVGVAEGLLVFLLVWWLALI